MFSLPFSVFFFATSLTVLTQLFKLSKHQDIYSLNVFLLCKITDLSRLFYHFLLNCDWEMWQFLMNTLDTDKYFINVAQRNRKRCNAPVKKRQIPHFLPRRGCNQRRPLQHRLGRGASWDCHLDSTSFSGNEE